MDAGIKAAGKTAGAQHMLGGILDTKKSHAKTVDVNALLGTATIRSVALVDMFIDRTYQRELDEARAKKIADNMNPSVLGEITVSDRGNGKFAIVDGQHRYHALCLLGYCKPGAVVVCRVFADMSLDEEAMTFAYLGGFKNLARRLNAWDLWKSRLSGLDRVALDIIAIARKRGLSVSMSKQHNSLSAVRAIEAIYNAGNLPETLDAAKAWANGDKKSADYYDGDVLKALSAFLREYEEVTPAMLAKRLDGITPNRLPAKIRDAVKTHDWSAPLAACMMIRDQYNSGLRKGKLPLPSGLLDANEE